MPDLRTLRARGPLLTLGVGGGAALLYALGVTPEQLAYHPAAPSLLDALACHMVHFSALHFRWDLTTFALVGAVSEWIDRRRYAWFLLVSAVLVPPLACTFEPWVGRYAGLSGLVVGQVAMWIAAELRRRPLVAVALLGLLMLKQLYELHVGNTSLVTMDYQGFHTVPTAHLVSTIVGIAFGWPMRPRRQGQSESPLMLRWWWSPR